MKLLISAGGTGGHIFPGIAVAEAFANKRGKDNVVFVGTTYGLEAKIIPKYGFRLLFADSRQFLGKSVIYKISTLIHLIRGIHTCMGLLKKERPDAILGMGGFTSVPVVLAGYFLGLPVFLHEQNAEPGLANKMLSRFAECTFISFEESKRHFGKRHVYHTGNPVRKTLKTSTTTKAEDLFSIFVFGGSRGARSINEAILTLLPYMESYKNCNMFHQTGAEDYERIFETYKKTNINFEVFPFTDDMGKYYALSDIVISRAGASTIFELAYFKRAAILIPYPFSAGQHQWKNASSVERLGGGYLIGNEEASGERLFEVIKHLMDEPGLLKKMGENIGKLYVADAEMQIISKIEEEIKTKH